MVMHPIQPYRFESYLTWIPVSITSHPKEEEKKTSFDPPRSPFFLTRASTDGIRLQCPFRHLAVAATGFGTAVPARRLPIHSCAWLHASVCTVGMSCLPEKRTDRIPPAATWVGPSFLPASLALRLMLEVGACRSLFFFIFSFNPPFFSVLDRTLKYLV